eukprot:140288-Pelagomonas_calceolata.AAC.1
MNPSFCPPLRQDLLNPSLLSFYTRGLFNAPFNPIVQSFLTIHPDTGPLKNMQPAQTQEAVAVREVSWVSSTCSVVGGNLLGLSFLVDQSLAIAKLGLRTTFSFACHQLPTPPLS